MIGGMYTDKKGGEEKRKKKAKEREKDRSEESSRGVENLEQEEEVARLEEYCGNH